MGNLYYGLALTTFLISFGCLLYIMSRTPSKEQRMLQTISTCVFVYDLGQLMAASSFGNDASIMGLRISHFGGVHTSLCFLVFFCMIAKIKLPAWIPTLIFIVDMGFAYGYTARDAKWFIKTIFYKIEGRGSIRIVSFTHYNHISVLWNILIFLSVFGIIIYCYYKKPSVFKYSFAAICWYFVAGTVTLITYSVTNLAETEFDYTSLGLTASLVMMFLITYIFNAFPTDTDTREDILNSMEDIVVSTDINHRLLYANRKAQEVFSEVPGFIYDMPLERLDPNLDKAFAAQNGDELEINSKFYRLYNKEIRNRFGRNTGTTRIMIDITVEKYFADEQIALKEQADSANLAKANFLAHMSHEIRTPINAIIGMDELIIRENQDPTTLEYAGNIMRAGKNLLTIINDILDFSKIEAGKMEIVESPYKLQLTLKDILSMIRIRANKKGLAVNINVNENTPATLNGDEVRIRQVITNILTNAVKYTVAGSVSIDVSTGSRDDGLVDLIVVVSDTGIGIKEEDIPKLYGSFERIENNINHKVEGTGLGMSITLSLINLMNGKLDVSSEYGKGSTFTITIPQTPVGNETIGVFREDEEVVTEASYAKKEYRAEDARILIVDDNSVNRVVAKSLLKRTGIKFDNAASGEECLIKIMDNHYDLILMDHLMPGMSGIETFNEIKSRSGHMCENVPVIALTADATAGIKKMFLENGFIDYISKPIDPATYEEKIAKYLPPEKVHYI